MPIFRQRADCTAVDFVCDECGDGRMRPNGEVMYTDPLKYYHECNNCGNKQAFDKTYPYPEL